MLVHVDGWHAPDLHAEECLNLHGHVVDLLCRRKLLQGVQGELERWIVPSPTETVDSIILFNETPAGWLPVLWF